MIITLFFIDGLKRPRGERPFRFEKMWLLHPGFKEMVRERWKSDMKAHCALKDLSGNLKGWNWRVFEELKGRKRNLLRRLEGIQRKVPQDRT